MSFASQFGLGSTRQSSDPVSAVGSLYSNASEGVDIDRDASLHGLESFSQLSIEKARILDVEDLDDEGWRIVALEKRIIELGRLGEGAGGSVTKCKLKGGETIFALKVGCSFVSLLKIVVDSSGHHNQPRS